MSVDTILIIGIPFFLLIFGLFLFFKSRETNSKSLKRGIILNLILNFIIFVTMVLASFDATGITAIFFLFIIFGIPLLILSITSVIFSIKSFRDFEQKSLSIASLVYGLIFWIPLIYYMLSLLGNLFFW